MEGRAFPSDIAVFIAADIGITVCLVNNFICDQQEMCGLVRF